MTDNELLLAISEIVEKKIKASVKPLQNDIANITEELRIIKIDLIENNVVPRLSNIEQHYISTASRYINSTESIESIQSDIDMMKKVVREHSEKMQKIS